jgi:hypothetical protein
MFTFTSQRKRYPSETVAPGLMRIMQGVFGVGSPSTQLSSPAEVGGNAAKGIYHYHEGDIFEPGTGNWVFEPAYETPLMTIWGHAFLRQPNTFKPLQPPQIYSNPNVVVSGIGGLVAGTMAFQPLIDPVAEQGG